MSTVTRRGDRTSFLILGLLSEEPLSGYEIRRITTQRFRFFWAESFGQIYPALHRLEGLGFIKARTAASGGHDRRRYGITPAGRNELADWLSEAAAPDLARSEGLLKIYFAWAGPEGTLATKVAEFGERASAAAAELESAERELLSIPDPHHNHQHALDIVRLGLATHGASAGWARDILAREGR